MQKRNAIRILHRNCAVYRKLRNWQWWKLYIKFGEDISKWMRLLCDIKKSRATFHTSETKKEFGPVVVDYAKVQSKVSLKGETEQEFKKVQDEEKRRWCRLATVMRSKGGWHFLIHQGVIMRVAEEKLVTGERDQGGGVALKHPGKSENSGQSEKKEVKKTNSSMKEMRRQLDEGEAEEETNYVKQQTIDAASTSDAISFITYIQGLKRKMRGWEKQVEVYREGQRFLERRMFQVPGQWLHEDNIDGESGAFNEIMRRKDSSIQNRVNSL